MSENNSLKKNQIGAVISYVNVAASIVVGLLVTPAIIKGLGDSEYGVYVLIASITSYLSVVQNGFSDTTIRYATKFRTRDDKEQAARFNGFSLCVNIVITILALLIGILLASKFPVIYGNSLSAEEISIAVRLLYLMLINIAITFMSNVFFGYLAAYEEFVLLRGLELANTIISYTLIYVVLLLGAGSYEIVLVTTFRNLVVALIEVCFCWKKLHIQFEFKLKKLEKSFLKEVSIYFLSVFIVVIVEQIYWKLDDILIAAFASAAALAVYSVGMSFHKYFMKFSTTISKVMAPPLFPAN